MSTIDNKKLVLIVDDDDDFRNSLITSPLLIQNFEVVGLKNGNEVINFLSSNSNVLAIVLDYDLWKGNENDYLNGIDVLKIINQKFPEVKVIMMSGVVELRGAIALESVYNYAYCFLDKPFKISSLVELLKKIADENITKEKQVAEILQKLSEFGFITKSRLIATQFINTLKTYNNDTISVLIVGESGTGKTLLAKILHQLSNFSNLPIVESHTATYSSEINMFKSHLFGHRKGAYTGAITDKKGIFETNGTIILDDIHHLPLECQKALLQVLQSRVFSRLGEEFKEKFFSGKIIATSTLSRDELLSRGMLKEFLTRICGDILYIPPLRERRYDIPLLIDFIKCKTSKPTINLEPSVIQKLTYMDWSEGNVRDLEYFVRRLINHSEGDSVSIHLLKNEIISLSNANLDTVIDYLQSISEEKGLDYVLEDIRKKIILRELEIHKGNISETAKALKCSNHSIVSYWLKKWKNL
ncbi:MAG: sigma 54-interacting transcriptional regulator [Ignavibacteria bacterium]|nr:sigma 54-interacting transcriptional regulator [Ignavibacteria bacterium]